MQGWSPAEYARWEKACGVDEEEIKKRAVERAKIKKQSDEMVKAFRQTCSDSGVVFVPKMGGIRCGKCRAKRF